jgi:phage baseplate assembly protein W
MPNERGELSYPTLEESVRQLIRILLSTRPGEQLMRPNFGVGLQNFVHQPNDSTTRRRIRDAIELHLGEFERRILVDRIEVEADVQRATHLRILVAYRLRRTGQPLQTSLVLDLRS